MKKVTERITLYIVKAVCECGGEFKPTGVMLTSYPPKYEHICTKCGKTATLDRAYPVFEQGGEDNGGN